MDFWIETKCIIFHSFLIRKSAELACSCLSVGENGILRVSRTIFHPFATHSNGKQHFYLINMKAQLIQNPKLLPIQIITLTCESSELSSISNS